MSFKAQPAQIRTGAFTHTALIVDGWRRNVHQDKDAECEVGESTGSRLGRDEPIAPVRAGCDGQERSAATSRRDVERCATVARWAEPCRVCVGVVRSRRSARGRIPLTKVPRQNAIRCEMR